jgi:hypothetical protein
MRLVARGQGSVQLLHDEVHHATVRGVADEEQLATNTRVPKHRVTAVWVDQYGHKRPFEEVRYYSLI